MSPFEPNFSTNNKVAVWPMVSVMIATFNSEKLLPQTLLALRNQDYPSDKLEILIIDGGSIDKTLDIAQDFDCRILHNDQTEPVHAKLLGMQQAHGKYLVTIDHDEVLQSTSSISHKVQVLQENPNCKVALCSGYKRPNDYPLINQYISEYGDPFSLYMYNFTKDSCRMEKELQRYFTVVDNSSSYMIVDFSSFRKQPLFELVCLGTMIDLDYFSQISDCKTNSHTMVHLFYIMLEKHITSLVYLKHDPVVHYSADSLQAYFPKLKWRICNNIHFQKKGDLGFEGRSKLQKQSPYKKYGFLIYSFSVIIPLIHGIIMAFPRKNPIYLIHPVLCLYVSVQILYQSVRKILGKTPSFLSYDGKKKIS